MKKFVVILLLLALCVSLVACGKRAAEPTTEPTPAPATEPAERKPIAPVSGNTPTLSNGSGCAGELNGGGE